MVGWGWEFATESRFIVEGGRESCSYIFNAGCVYRGLAGRCHLKMKTILEQVRGR